MWFVYVLLCDGGSLYTGVSSDPQKRFLEHQTGKGARYTRMHKPQKIIHLEKFLTKGAALIQQSLNLL